MYYSDTLLADAASDALESGDWATASDAICALQARGARGAGVRTLDQVPLGNSLRGSWERALRAAIEQVNEPA